MLISCVEEGDVLTAVLTKQDMERDGRRWVDNSSGDVVILVTRNKQPVFLEPSNQQLWQWSWRDFLPSLTLFRFLLFSENPE